MRLSPQSYESYDQYLARKVREWGDSFNPLDLDPRFLPYFGTGQRIRVHVDVFDKDVTGCVSVTSGWKPSFLLVRRRSDHGSVYLLGPKDTIIAVQHARTYFPYCTPMT